MSEEKWEPTPGTLCTCERPMHNYAFDYAEKKYYPKGGMVKSTVKFLGRTGQHSALISVGKLKYTVPMCQLIPLCTPLPEDMRAPEPLYSEG